MPRIEESLQALGEWSVTLRLTAQVAAELTEAQHLRFYSQGEPIFTGVILWVAPDEANGTVRVGGRSIEWELGSSDDRGPSITDVEFIAGTNKLNNGNFEKGNILWTIDNEDIWIIRDVVGESRSSPWCAVVAGHEDGTAVLRADDSYVVRSGERFQGKAFFRRQGGSSGRVHMRMVFSGRFPTLNMLSDPGFEAGGVGWSAPTGFVVVAEAFSAREGTYVVRVSQNGQEEIILNGDFEQQGNWINAGTVSTWSILTDNAHPHDGVGYAQCTATGAAQNAILHSDSDPNAASAQFYSVTPGDRFRLAAWVYASGVTAGNIHIDVKFGNSGNAQTGVQASDVLALSSLTGWMLIETEFSMPSGANGMDRVAFAVVVDNSNGTIYFDTIKAFKLEGNIATLTHSAVDVQEGQGYRLQAAVRTGPQGIGGRLHVKAVFRGAYRNVTEVQGQTIEVTRDQWRDFDVTFTPPTGMDTMEIVFTSEDITGDYWYLDQVFLRVADKTKRIFEVKTGNRLNSYASYVLDVTTPRGAEEMHFEFLAEGLSDGWQVDDVTLIRLGGPTTIATVFDRLLKNDAGQYILNPGRIFGSDNLRYDWRLQLSTNRRAIAELARNGFANPLREWRTNWDGTVDFGTAAQIFADRTQVIVTADDVQLRQKPVPERNIEDFITEVKVIGDLRESPSKKKYLITGSATNSDRGYTGLFGQPLRRTRIVTESGITQLNQAADVARSEADKDNAPINKIKLSIVDWQAWWGKFDCGDWIYVYLPEAQIFDRANERMVQGETVFPQKIRILSRTVEYAENDLTVEVLTAGAPVDITNYVVDWASSTTADLEVGNLPPSMLADPRGLGRADANLQFAHWRALSGTPIV